MILSEIETDGVVKTPSEEFFDNRIICEWFSTKEAAAYLGITQNALRIMVFRGKVRAYKLGRRLKFRGIDLRSLFKERGDPWR